MQPAQYFHQDHKKLLKEAADIAEEVTSDFFKLSPATGAGPGTTS